MNGSSVSRRAAEITFALARPTGARVSALFVSQSDGHSRTRYREEGVLKDMVELAERYDVRLTTLISKRSGPAEAILREARNGYGMIAMGVNSRVGEGRFFGNTAAAVFQEWDRSPAFGGLGRVMKFPKPGHLKSFILWPSGDTPFRIRLL